MHQGATVSGSRVCITCTADVPQEMVTLPGEGSGACSVSPSAHEDCNVPAPAAASSHLQRITPSTLVPIAGMYDQSLWAL